MYHVSIEKMCAVKQTPPMICCLSAGFSSFGRCCAGRPIQCFQSGALRPFGPRVPVPGQRAISICNTRGSRGGMDHHRRHCSAARQAIGRGLFSALCPGACGAPSPHPHGVWVTGSAAGPRAAPPHGPPGHGGPRGGPGRPLQFLVRFDSG